MPSQEMVGLLRQRDWDVSSQVNRPFKPFDADLFVLFQSWPGEFSESFVLSLKWTSPLAPVILLAGSAAEGEARTGKIPAGVFRLYAHQWNAEYLAEFARFLEKKPSIFSLPPTFEAEEVALWQSRQDKPLWRPRQSGMCEAHSVTHSSPAATMLTAVERGEYTPSVPSPLFPPLSYCIVARFGPFGNDNAMNAMLADWYGKIDCDVCVGLDKIEKNFVGTIIADADDSPFSQILEAAQSLRHDFADADIEVCINSPRINEKMALEDVGVNRVKAKNNIQ